MQRYTHPQVFQTLINRKEGSTVSKEWFFLRPRLALDSDSPNWERLNLNRANPALTAFAGRSAIRRIGERFRSKRINQRVGQAIPNKIT